MTRTFRIAADHPALDGHFPGNPVVPGVVVLDHVLAAIEARAGALGPLRLPQVKFVQPLLPQQTATVVLEDRPAAQCGAWRFRVERDGALIASGEIVADAAP